MNHDQNLMSQMIAAGKFDSLYELIKQQNEMKLAAAIKYLGNRWCLHPSHTKKKLKKPLPDKVLFFRGKNKQTVKVETELSPRQERFVQLFL